MNKIDNQLAELGFFLEQGDTVFHVREGFGENIAGNTDIILKYGDHVIYNGVYSRGVARFYDEIPKEPSSPVSVYTAADYESQLKAEKKNLLRFRELSKKFAGRKRRYRYERPDNPVHVREEEKEEAQEYLRLMSRTLRTDVTSLTEDLCYPSRIKSTISWYERNIAGGESMIESWDQFDKDHAEWRLKMESITSTKPVTLTDAVYPIMADATEDTFEEFCDSLGYDTDCRKALATWEDCRNIHDNLEAAGVSGSVRDKVAELLGDY